MTRRTATFALAAGIVLLAFCVIILAVRAHTSRTDACTSRGGRVVTTTDTEREYDKRKRRWVTDTDTTYRCVHPDGRVSDTWGDD